VRKPEKANSPVRVVRKFSHAEFQALVFKAAERAVRKKDWDAFWVVVSAVVASHEYDAAHAQVGWVIGNLEFLLKDKLSGRPKKTRAEAKADPRLKRLNAKRNKASAAARAADAINKKALKQARKNASKNASKDLWRGLARIPKNKLGEALAARRRPANKKNSKNSKKTT
jgi:hypothetical protein